MEPPDYKRTVLQSTEAFEIVQCDWKQGDRSALHDHGWSQCYALVQEGTFENVTDTGTQKERAVMEPGQVIETAVGSMHDIRCLSKTGRSLHVYIPPIKESGNPLFYPGTAAQLRASLDLVLGEEGISWAALKQSLKSIEDHSLTANSPYFMNQLFSGVTPESLLAQDVIHRTRTTLATYEASPALTLVESETVQALCHLIGWPKDSADGIAVPGGSAANFMAVHCARQKKFPQIKAEGMGDRRFQVFVSAEAHYSFKKAAAVLGLGTNAIVAVDVDERGRMKPSDLEKKIKICEAEGATPLMVCATAGTTVLGAFDPIAELSKICRPKEIWLHVDGAWGGPALFSKKIRSLMEGVEQADSVAFDAHKLMGAPLTCSFFLTREPKVLLQANDVAGGEYLFHDDDEIPDRGRLSWQCGRGADALGFWTLWKSMGTAGLGALVDRLIDVKDEAIPWIRSQPRLQLVGAPDFLNICVRVHPPIGEDKQWSLRVRHRLRETQQVMVNYSSNAEGPFLRLILAHPRMNFEIVKDILERALRIEAP